MSEDHVDLDPQQVANGLANWDQVADTLQARWKAVNAKIDRLLNAKTWGSDEPGRNFQKSVVDEGLAGTLAERGQEAVTNVQEAGQGVRKSVEASLAADQQQASEVGGVGVPAFNNASGGGGGSSSGGGGGGPMTMSGGSSAGSSGMMMTGEGEALLAPGQGAQSPIIDERQTMPSGTEHVIPEQPELSGELPVATADQSVAAERSEIFGDAPVGAADQGISNGPTQRGAETGPVRQLPEGRAQDILDRVAQHLPDGLVQQLPEGGMTERISERISEAGIPYTPMGEHTEFIPRGDEVTGRPGVQAPR